MAKSSAATTLIAAARLGDDGALERLWEMYRHYLRLMARTSIDVSLQGKADPSDLVQETLLKATKNFGRFRGTTEAELTAWLRRILVQALTDLTRRYRWHTRQVRRERSISELVEGSSVSLARLIGRDSVRSELAADDRDLGVLLAEALAQLDPDDREVITLRSLEQLEWQQVANRMGRTPDAARMLWVRALRRLRPILRAKL